MSIQKYTVSNDPSLYEAWPDVVLTDSGRLICVFSECTHHGNREYTRVMLTDSIDRGRTWTPKRPLTEGTRGLPYYYNCARIAKMPDGRLAITIDKIPNTGEKDDFKSIIQIYFSEDDGRTWSAPQETPIRGIMPDKLTVVDNGRWIIAVHHCFEDKLTQYIHYSDNCGKTWSEPVMVAHDQNLNLCEASLLNAGGGNLVIFMRENSSIGLPCKKVISHDNGLTWSRIFDFPIPGCHRPTAGFLRDGNVLITCRMHHGSAGWLGTWTQNLLAALTDKDSCLLEADHGANDRILPIDYDRSPVADTGYSGWVQFEDGEIYIVNYIVDDAIDKAQIRGYSLSMDDFILNR